MKKLALLTLLLPLLAGCMKDDFVDYTIVDEEIISEYLTENNIQAERDPSGLYYKIINEGTGAPIGDDVTQDDKVTFSFKGYLTNGSVFADTEGENITQYLSQILLGFRIGLPKINREGEIHLYVPSGLAYGSSGNSGVPANSVVIFEVKVDRDQADIDEDVLAAYLEENSIVAESDESGLYYQIHEEGEGDNVSEYSSIDATYEGTLLDGTMFDEGTVSNFLLSGAIEAWRIGIPKLKKGGSATFYCPSQLAYGHIPQVDNDGEVKIPANSILVFNVTIVDF